MRVSFQGRWPVVSIAMRTSFARHLCLPVLQPQIISLSKILPEPRSSMYGYYIYFLPYMDAMGLVRVRTIRFP